MQEELGLGWYSFKWRNYDPAIGRFFNVDPLAEKYVYNGVYNFSENKVIAFRELEGLEAIPSTHASEIANQRLGQQGLNNPYKPGTTVNNYCTQCQQIYARVYTEGITNPQGRWLVDPAEINGLSPSEIQAKLALPNEPTHSDVVVPEGTKITVGEIGENFGFTPKGTMQIELREEIPMENFTNFRMLEPPPILEPVPVVPILEPTPTVIEPMPIVEPPIIEPLFIP